MVILEDLRMQHLSIIVGGVPFSSWWTFKHREGLVNVGPFEQILYQLSAERQRKNSYLSYST